MNTLKRPTQQDHMVRIVALENLKAMCEHVSGMCHRFNVTKVTRSRVHVTYSNPDEYGNEFPMTAIYPCYPSPFPGDEENPRVILDVLRVLNDNWGGEGHQAFDQVIDSPQLWRDPVLVEKWRTREEIIKAGLMTEARTLAEAEKAQKPAPETPAKANEEVVAKIMLGISNSMHSRAATRKEIQDALAATEKAAFKAGFERGLAEGKSGQ